MVWVDAGVVGAMLLCTVKWRSGARIVLHAIENVKIEMIVNYFSS